MRSTVTRLHFRNESKNVRIQLQSPKKKSERMDTNGSKAKRWFLKISLVAAKVCGKSCGIGFPVPGFMFGFYSHATHRRANLFGDIIVLNLKLVRTHGAQNVFADIRETRTWMRRDEG